MCGCQSIFMCGCQNISMCGCQSILCLEVCLDRYHSIIYVDVSLFPCLEVCLYGYQSTSMYRVIFHPLLSLFSSRQRAFITSAFKQSRPLSDPYIFLTSLHPSPPYIFFSLLSSAPSRWLLFGSYFCFFASWGMMLYNV